MKASISLLNVLDEFLRMEEDESLFTLQTSDGIYYWDIIRLNIYVKLHTIYGGAFASSIPVQLQRPSFSLYIKDVVKKILNIFTRQYLARRRPKYVFISVQRIRQGGKLIDEISDHLYGLLLKESIAIELSNKRAINYLYIFLGLRTRAPQALTTICYRDPDLNSMATKISEVIFKYFNVKIESKDLIDEELKVFRSQKKYYLNLFNRHRPKAFICVNNGTLKGLYSAAKERNIPTFELQHGEISSFSARSKYPPCIASSDEGIYLPTVLMTFSDYWNDVVYFPAKKIVSIGNDYFSQALGPQIGDGVLFVSADMYQESLLKLSIAVAENNKNRAVYFKLHPHEFCKKSAIKNIIKGLPNFFVITDDINFQELFKRSAFIIGVHSTMIYTALQAGKKVCIYKYAHYFYHKDIFPYVELFDNASGLIDILENRSGDYFEKINKSPIFFKPFNFLEFSEELMEYGVDIKLLCQCN
jgi:hypothetical protein